MFVGQYLAPITLSLGTAENEIVIQLLFYSKWSPYILKRVLKKYDKMLMHSIAVANQQLLLISDTSTLFLLI